MNKLQEAIKLSEVIENYMRAMKYDARYRATESEKHNAEVSFLFHAGNNLAKFRESSRVLMEAIIKIEKWASSTERNVAEGAIKAVERIWEEK